MAVVGAVAVGAVTAASQTAALGLTTGSVDPENDTLAFGIGDRSDSDAAAPVDDTGGERDSSVTEPAAAHPADVRVTALTLEQDPVADVTALSKGFAIAEEAAKPKLGVPYKAGNNDNLDGWIAQALGMMGLPQTLAPGVREIIMAESKGNPDAVNNWDSNAAQGTPSKGLMQVIPSSFELYVHPELRDRPITDPVANITAGVRCMIANHGIDTVLAGGRRGSGGYIGYGGGEPFKKDVEAWARALQEAGAPAGPELP